MIIDNVFSIVSAATVKRTVGLHGVDCLKGFVTLAFGHLATQNDGRQQLSITAVCFALTTEFQTNWPWFVLLKHLLLFQD